MTDASVRSRFASLGKQVGAQVSVGLHRLLGSRSGNAFGILMFHRVTDIQPDVPAPTWNVTPARFREQLDGLLTRGYRVLSLRAVIQLARAGNPVPERTAVVTFDDGYQNSYAHALPILKEFNVPATVFVATAFVDSTAPLPFDSWGSRYHLLTPREDWQALTWAQCREMESSGLVEIGSHSHTHDDFRGRAEVLERDLSQSLAMLRERLGRADFTFAFPYGGKRLGYADERLIDVARRSGALCALTSETELASPASEPFGWGRYEVVQSDDGDAIAAKLAGWYDWMGRARDVFRLVAPPKSAASVSSDRSVAP